jgi:N-acetylmuramic acid 6-phosphate etherase
MGERMSTEETSHRSSGLDMWPTSDAVMAMFEDQLAAAAAVQSQVEQLATAAEEAAQRLEQPDGRLVYVGAGTSGRLAVLDGTELEPTFGWSRDRLVYAVAGGSSALSASVENAEDDDSSGREVMKSAHLKPSDVVIGVSASGTTAFTVAAIEEAATAGALTIGIANNPGAALLLAARHPILLDTGPELISGSTRMKAGTAQKIALNLLSTAIMLRGGHVYDGLMVDMKASNRKLRARATRMVAQISGVATEKAARALDSVQGNVKIAALVAMGMSAEEAKELLEVSGNNLRTAITKFQADRTARG